MNRLLIIGAGGFGREVLAWARAHSDYGRRWVIGGFLDDTTAALEPYNLGLTVVATLRNYEPNPTDMFVCAIGTPADRALAYQTISARGGRFICLVHPSAIISDRAKLGDGIVVCPFALVSADAEVQEGSAIYYHSSVDHDAVVGPFCQVSAHCDITGGARLGRQVFMGSHAAILPGVSVGDFTVVGAGAVVVDDLPANVTAVGVPARVIKHA